MSAGRSDPCAARSSAAGLPRAAVAVALVVFAALVIARAPELLTSPRFSAEEGAVYFQFALESGPLTALFTPHMDYLVLYENLAVVAAAHLVPLESAPLVTTLAGLLVQLVAPALVLTGRAHVWNSPWRRAAGVLLVLVVQPSAEVWLNTNTAQFHAAVIVLLVLLEPTAPPVAGRRGLYRALVVGSGLTGAVASFLVPAALYRAWVRRDRESRVQAALLTGCARAQAGALLASRSRMGGLHRSLIIDPGTTGLALLTRTALQPVLGVGAASDAAVLAERAGPVGYQLAGVLVATVFLLLLLRSAGGDPELRTHAVAFFALAAPSLLFATGSNLLDTRRPLLHPLVHDRYIYAPAVVLLLYALRRAEFSRRRPAALAAAGMVAAACLQGALTYRSSMRFHVHPRQPDWRAEVRRVRDEGATVLRVWPADFTVTYRDR